jgi:hypothetical protein
LELEKTIGAGKKHLSQFFDIRKKIMRIDEPGQIGILNIETQEVKLYN